MGGLKPPCHLNMLHGKRFLILGIGNPFLQDDRAGIEVVERLADCLKGVDKEVLFTVGFEVLDKIRGYDEAIIIDAARFGKPPGTVMELDLQDVLASASFTGSHSLSLGVTLQIGYSVFADELPKKVRLFFIEAAEITRFSNECTVRVNKAIERVTEKIQSIFRVKP